MLLRVLAQQGLDTAWLKAIVACMAVAQSSSCHAESATESGHYLYISTDKPCHIAVLTSVHCAHYLHTNYEQQHQCTRQCWRHLQGSQSCRQQWPAALPAAPCSRRNNRHSPQPACLPASLPACWKHNNTPLPATALLGHPTAHITGTMPALSYTDTGHPYGHTRMQEPHRNEPSLLPHQHSQQASRCSHAVQQPPRW
jgi:hypothetical protein